jgi:hypothetical protein
MSNIDSLIVHALNCQSMIHVKCEDKRVIILGFNSILVEKSDNFCLVIGGNSHDAVNINFNLKAWDYDLEMHFYNCTNIKIVFHNFLGNLYIRSNNANIELEYLSGSPKNLDIDFINSSISTKSPITWEYLCARLINSRLQPKIKFVDGA